MGLGLIRVTPLLFVMLGGLGACATTPRAPDAWASVQCDVTSSGKPENCVVVDEQPANEGWEIRRLPLCRRGGFPEPRWRTRSRAHDLR